VIEVVETERLRGERISPAHHEVLCALLGDPRVGATLGGVRTAKQVGESLARSDAHWERHGFGLWAFRERRTGAFVGRGGLLRSRVDGRDEIEVAWAVMADRWNEGFATELGACAVGVAFERLALPDVVAFTLHDNRASIRVMDKLGFVYEKDVMHAGLPHVLYRIARAT
jgi:[ribosomal protein S5]-alanine N-acetyltransferase